MAFMKTKQYESTPNILESEVGLVLKTYTADATNATAVNDKKIKKRCRKTWKKLHRFLVFEYLCMVFF